MAARAAAAGAAAAAAPGAPVPAGPRPKAAAGEASPARASPKKRAAKGAASPSDKGDEDDDELEEEEDEEGEMDEDVEEGAGGDAGPQRPGAFRRLTRFFSKKDKGGKADKGRRNRMGADESVSPEDRLRAWDLQMCIRSLNYVGSEAKIDTFFTFSILPIEPRHVRSRVRLLPEYSPACILRKNDPKVLDTPAIVWRSKLFKMSYKDLDKYILKVSMWKISKMSFNTYIGRGDRSLKRIASNDADTNFAVKEKLTKEAEERKKKKRMVLGDVAMLGLTINCEEIFDFQLNCENWSLELDRSHPLWKNKREFEKKALTFIVPKSKFSDASKGHNCSSTVVKWMGPETEQKCVWAQVERAEPFRFRGTSTALQSHCIIVRVHSAKIYHASQPAMNKTIGNAMMNLTSVLDISVFSGIVKDLQKDRNLFLVGKVTGSIKVITYSMNCKTVDHIKGGRPQQPKSAATVGHLRRTEQHLVVRVQKCDNLAVADPDTASSDPYLRCTWDNMLQRSYVLNETVRPVFNFNFYFPVRLFNPKLKKKMYRGDALMFELESKGDISVQVWDADEASSDSLGLVRLPLSKLLKSKPATRTLRGPPKRVEDEDEDVEQAPASREWFEVEREVRVFDGNKTELTGCSMPNDKTALIYFEAYFYPDWPDGVVMQDEEETGENNGVWEEKEAKWIESGMQFVKKYADPFPDAIGALPCKADGFNRGGSLRRFTCISKHPQTMEDLPLMAFPCKITTPEEYVKPGALLHWVSCFSFYNSSRQERTGLIPVDGWKDPQTFLFTKKGPVQDHALLLCSVLLGSKQDAYVCKGTIQVPDEEAAEDETKKKLVEHVWVMTREAGGWVTFWEPCTREMYHLPERWSKASKRMKDVRKMQAKRAEGGEIVADEDDENVGGDEADGGQIQLAPTNEIADELLEMKDLEGLPTVGRMPKPKERAKRKINPRDKAKADWLRQQNRAICEPRMKNPNLCQEGLIVEWLPYDSIDIVFNMHNVWANRQNHHPACITYNFEPPYDFDPDKQHGGWEALIGEPYLQERANYDWAPVSNEAVIDAAYATEWIEKREAGMVSEMEENLRASRGKLGLDTYFERPQKTQEVLTQFLVLCEKMWTLDIDFCPCLKRSPEEWDDSDKFLMKLRFGSSEKGKQSAVRYNKLGSAFGSDDSDDRYAGYRKEQENEWRLLQDKFDAYREGSNSKRSVVFNVAKGHKFTGMPVHFCTSDREEIRCYLLDMEEYKNMAQDKLAASFIVHCKLFPLLGGVQSTWLYIGMQTPTQ